MLNTNGASWLAALPLFHVVLVTATELFYWLRYLCLMFRYRCWTTAVFSDWLRYRYFMFRYRWRSTGELPDRLRYRYLMLRSLWWSEIELSDWLQIVMLMVHWNGVQTALKLWWCCLVFVYPFKVAKFYEPLFPGSEKWNYKSRMGLPYWPAVLQKYMSNILANFLISAEQQFSDYTITRIVYTELIRT